MLRELQQGQFDQVEALFRPLSFQPFCTAVLAGIFPGRVFVDDLVQPESACVLTRDNWIFLAGTPDNQAFNEALRQAIWRREIVREDVGALLFTYTPQAWVEQMAALCHPCPAITVDRHQYACHTLAYDWRAALPEDASLFPLTPALMNEPDLVLPGELRETLQRWADIDHPDFADFGFLLSIDGAAAAWATVDGVVNGVGDLGFFTVEAFRRRGLGTLVAAAAIDTGLAHGLHHIVWTCNASNLGSVATARKLGLERQDDYTLTFLIFDEAGSWAQLAYNHLVSGRYAAALTAYERVRALLAPLPSWIYHDLARVHAGLGQMAEAVTHLEKAVAAGWIDVAETRSCPEFALLAGMPDWEAILSQMAAQATTGASR